MPFICKLCHALSYTSHTQGMAQPPKKKKGLLSKIFGRKKKDHDSFCSPALPLPEDLPTPTVVILNSLNHNQLLELLRVIV